MDINQCKLEFNVLLQNNFVQMSIPVFTVQVKMKWERQTQCTVKTLFRLSIASNVTLKYHNASVIEGTLATIADEKGKTIILHILCNLLFTVKTF